MASKNESYVVQSKIKALIKKGKMKTSSDVSSALNQFIAQTINKACTRAKANGRKTVRASDI
jgi:histone H3/H4